MLRALLDSGLSIVAWCGLGLVCQQVHGRTCRHQPPSPTLPSNRRGTGAFSRRDAVLHVFDFPPKFRQGIHPHVGIIRGILVRAQWSDVVAAVSPGLVLKPCLLDTEARLQQGNHERLHAEKAIDVILHSHVQESAVRREDAQHGPGKLLPPTGTEDIRCDDDLGLLLRRPRTLDGVLVSIVNDLQRPWRLAFSMLKNGLVVSQVSRNMFPVFLVRGDDD
mmetsp:Transcript_79552/g.170534  ORF Transcript_79552/g.170534 Transcript_79552/m.170534 type:complete len:220 (-) Transcript_79552:486-1145(-)